MVFLNANKNKFHRLIESLSDCDKRRRYSLTIATCYCNIDVVRELIVSLQKKLELFEVWLYIDRRQAISIGTEALQELETSFPDLLTIYAIRTSYLFHTKGFCITAYSKSDELLCGRLVIGSANVTEAGLKKDNGNNESLVIDSNIHTISEFLDFFNRSENLICLDKLTEFETDNDAEEIDFRYSLLKSGIFSHKWNATLTQYFSVKYGLSEEGKQRTHDTIQTPGFQIDSATISKSYLDFSIEKYRATPKNFVRNYGIECFLGHWFPLSAYNMIQSESETKFAQFQRDLKKYYADKRDNVFSQIKRDQKSLLKEGIIARECKPESTFSAFEAKVKNLLKDKDQLKRISSQRYFFEFPDDSSNVDWIDETFDDILRTAGRSNKKNKSMRAVLEADEFRELEPILNV